MRVNCIFDRITKRQKKKFRNAGAEYHAER